MMLRERRSWREWSSLPLLSLVVHSQRIPGALINEPPGYCCWVNWCWQLSPGRFVTCFIWFSSWWILRFGWRVCWDVCIRRFKMWLDVVSCGNPKSFRLVPWLGEVVAERFGTRGFWGARHEIHRLHSMEFVFSSSLSVTKGLFLQPTQFYTYYSTAERAMISTAIYLFFPPTPRPYRHLLGSYSLNLEQAADVNVSFP